jgi:acetate kinase
LRKRICSALEWLGITIDDQANDAHAASISTTRSRVRVAVEPTNEEWVAARHALEVVPQLDVIAHQRSAHVIEA